MTESELAEYEREQQEELEENRRLHAPVRVLSSLHLPSLSSHPIDAAERDWDVQEYKARKDAEWAAMGGAEGFLQMMMDQAKARVAALESPEPQPVPAPGPALVPPPQEDSPQPEPSPALSLEDDVFKVVRSFGLTPVLPASWRNVPLACTS